MRLQTQLGDHLLGTEVGRTHLKTQLRTLRLLLFHQHRFHTLDVGVGDLGLHRAVHKAVLVAAHQAGLSLFVGAVHRLIAPWG